MYDHDPDEVSVLGWEEFVLRQWESIFTGYRSWAGLRTLGRRWSDLIEAGLDCPQEVADWLVSTTVIGGPDRRLGSAKDPMVTVSEMIQVLEDIPAALASAEDMDPRFTAALLDRHARLLDFIRAEVFGGTGDPG